MVEEDHCRSHYRKHNRHHRRRRKATDSMEGENLMARIMNDLIVKNVGSGRWELVQPIEYHVGSENSPEVVIVPVGFVTDFASVPFGVRNLFPRDGKWTKAAIPHDYLYFTLGLHGKYSRKECDKIFLEIMEVLNVSWIQRHVMYRAVRVGGGFGWKKRKKQLATL